MADRKEWYDYMVAPDIVQRDCCFGRKHRLVLSRATEIEWFMQCVDCSKSYTIEKRQVRYWTLRRMQNPTTWKRPKGFEASPLVIEGRLSAEDAARIFLPDNTLTGYSIISTHGRTSRWSQFWCDFWDTLQFWKGN